MYFFVHVGFELTRPRLLTVLLREYKTWSFALRTVVGKYDMSQTYASRTKCIIGHGEKILVWRASLTVTTPSKITVLRRRGLPSLVV